MTFSLHQEGVVMWSQITHTINIHPLAKTLDTWALIFSSCGLLQFIPTGSCNGIPPLSRWYITGAYESGPKQHRAKQKWPREKLSYICSRTLHSFRSIVAQSPPSFLCCPRPPSHHPSSITSVYLVPALNTLLAIRYTSVLSTCPNSSNTAQTVL